MSIFFRDRTSLLGKENEDSKSTEKKKKRFNLDSARPYAAIFLTAAASAACAAAPPFNGGEPTLAACLGIMLQVRGQRLFTIPLGK